MRTERNAMLNVLIADDDRGERKELRRTLERSGLAVDCVETETMEQAIAAAESREFDCAIVDYRMPGMSGLDGIAALHERHPFMVIIMATGQGDESIATEAMKRGAADYVTKGTLDASSVKHAIDGAMEKAALQRSLALQRQELEAFAAVLAHDLKAPLNSIRSFAQLIEQAEAQAPDTEKVLRYSRNIGDAAKRMEQLIRTLQQYAQSGAKAALRPVAMAGMVDDAVANLDERIRASGAAVTHGDLPTVMGDASLLIQLLQNLIANAIKFCEGVPKIHISAEPVGEGDWRFAVRDNGIGIPAGKNGDLFKPFTRLHGGGKYEGTGLGLATCKKIVERHGGAIRCESEEGKGSTFFFTLPGARAHDRRQGAGPHAKEDAA
jgi:hypothetical protein